MKLVSSKSKVAALTVLAGSLLLAGNASAGPAEDLLKKHACTACHAIDGPLVGPAYKKVAEKYRGDAKAEAMLVQKVLNGGAGTWGQIPMPPHKGRVPDADVQNMIKFILALK